MERPLSPPPTEQFRDLYPALNEWLQAVPTLLPRINKYTASLNVASVGAGLVSRQTFTVPEINVSDSIFINAPALPAGLEMLASYYVSAASTIVIPFWNTTGGAIDPAAATYTIWAFR